MIRYWPFYLYFIGLIGVLVWMNYDLRALDKKVPLIVAEPTESMLYQDRNGTTFRCKEWERQ